MTPAAHLAYDDSGSVADLDADCRATRAALGLESRLSRAARLATQPAPSLHFDEQLGERPKRSIEISEATAALAAAIYEGRI